MAPAIAVNGTDTPTFLMRCVGDYFNRRLCYIRISRNETDGLEIIRIFKCLFGCNTYYPHDYDQDYGSRRSSGNEMKLSYQPYATSTLAPKMSHTRSGHDETLQFIAFNILLPIVLVLIAICFILGVVLIVKSYMMAPLKQNLATAIRRRRRVGHAPDNNYIPPAEMRASQRLSTCSDRKSLPPPEVLMAARERASQLLSMPHNVV